MFYNYGTFKIVSIVIILILWVFYKMYGFSYILLVRVSTFLE